MSLQKLIDFGIIPIDSFEVSSNEDGFEAVKVFDGNLSTAWKPSVNQPNSWYKVNFLTPHPFKAFDIALGKGDKRKYIFTVEVNDGSKWIKVNTYETRGTTLEPLRVNIPDTLAKSVKLTFRSYDEAGHMGVIPEVTELRFYGVIDEDEAPGSVIIPELGCPEGYALDVGTGRCIKDVQFQILVPDSITAEGATSTEGNTDALLDIATDIAFTVKGKNAKVVEKFNAPVNVNAIVIDIENKGFEYNLVVNIPNKSQTPVIIQKGISETSFILDQTATTDTIELISNNDELVLIDFYGLGSKAKVEEKPPVPTEGRKREKGAKQDATKWVAAAMQTPEGEFTHEVNDENGVQEADQFTSLAKAQEYIAYYIWKQGGEVEEPPVVEPPVVEPPITEPPTTGDKKLDAQGVLMIYAPKQGGQIITEKDTYQKESVHDGTTRSSLYSTIEYVANSGEITDGFVMDLSDNGEQNAPKLMSGGHTGSGDNDKTRQGQCYAVGINQNGTLHLAKEYPHHPTTPKAYDKIQYLDPNWKSLGDIRNKLVFMKIIYFPVDKAGKKGIRLEWWFDKKGFETQKLENDFKQMAFAEDFGDWGNKFGPPHLQNNGIKYKGKVLGHYTRVDSPKKPVKFQKCGQHEIGENPTKLV